MRGREVHIPEPSGGGAFAAIAPGATRGVVVIHEIFGRAPEIDRVIERFARQGYAAVGPDLFHGRSPVFCIRAAMKAIQTGAGPAIDQILRARDWLCAEAGIRSEQVGIIGFCLGGGFALAAGRGWGAVSTNYGDVPPAEVLRGVGPVIGCYGGRDVVFRNKGELLRKRMDQVGAKPPSIHLYKESGHSFLTDGHHPIGAALSYPLLHVKYDPVASEDAWGKIFEFFGQHLGAA